MNNVIWTIERRYSEFRTIYLLVRTSQIVAFTFLNTHILSLNNFFIPQLKDQLLDHHAFPPKTIVNNKVCSGAAMHIQAQDHLFNTLVPSFILHY